MARWIVGRGANQMIITTSGDGHVVLHVPSGEPIVADRDTAQDIRAKIGAAIGVANLEAGR